MNKHFSFILGLASIVCIVVLFLFLDLRATKGLPMAGIESVFAACGDGGIDGPEECDDGNMDDGDGCNSACINEFCGDSTTNNNSEECDDGNLTNEDGCSNACLNEVCGDNVTQAGLGEECDDGNTDSGDGCDANCLSEICGDGEIATNEECDDGDLDNGDGCSDACEEEPGFVCNGEPSTCDNSCGDGFYDSEGPEECDDGNLDNDDGCDDNCNIEPICANGDIEDGEECDDGNADDGDGCNALCQNEVCGDSTTQAGLGEECDDGNTDDEDGCSSACLNEYCGDSATQGGLGETCDDGNTDDEDGCNASCITEECGDSTVQTGLGEECDDGNTNDDDGCSSSCLTEVADTDEEEFDPPSPTPTSGSKRGSYGCCCLPSGTVFVSTKTVCEQAHPILGYRGNYVSITHEGAWNLDFERQAYCLEKTAGVEGCGNETHPAAPEPEHVSEVTCEAPSSVQELFGDDLGNIRASFVCRDGNAIFAEGDVCKRDGEYSGQSSSLESGSLPDVDADDTGDDDAEDAFKDRLENEVEDSFEPCLALDPSRNLVFDDVDDSFFQSSYIVALKNTKIVRDGDYIFSGRHNHSTGKNPGRFSMGSWEFQPLKHMSRLEVVKTALVSNCIPIADEIPAIERNETFIDVSPSVKKADTLAHFTARVFYTARKSGIVSGSQARPYETATLEETLAILQRAADVIPEGYDAEEGAMWYERFVRFAQDNGILKGIRSDEVGGAVLRQDFAVMVLRVMTFNPDPRIHGYAERLDLKPVSYQENGPVYQPIPDLSRFPITPSVCEVPNAGDDSPRADDETMSFSRQVLKFIFQAASTVTFGFL